MFLVSLIKGATVVSGPLIRDDSCSNSLACVCFLCLVVWGLTGLYMSFSSGFWDSRGGLRLPGTLFRRLKRTHNLRAMASNCLAQAQATTTDASGTEVGIFRCVFFCVQCSRHDTIQANHLNLFGKVNQPDQSTKSPNHLNDNHLLTDVQLRVP